MGLVIAAAIFLVGAVLVLVALWRDDPGFREGFKDGLGKGGRWW